jgi:hypothetical protein
LIIPDPGPGAIRFGILYGGAALENWQIRCLEQLASVPGVRAEVSIAPGPSRVPLGGAWAELPNIPIELSPGSCTVAPLAASSIDRLRDCQLEFILCFADGVLPLDILDAPRHGIWRYQLGDWVSYRGSPQGFWEVFDGCAVSAALLVRVQPDPDAIVVLREGFLRTRALSVRKNREQLLARFTHWPAEVCRDIKLGRSKEICAKPALRTGAAVRPPPALWHRCVLAARIAARAAATGFRALFRHDQWNIGIIDRPIAQFLTMSVLPEIEWLPATRRSELRADPFGTLYQGRPTILCEYFSYRDNRGFIVAIDPERGAAGARVQIGPDRPVHLSYPFLFEAGGRLLCVPESSAAKEIVLYEVERFPDRWVKAATLIAGRAFADATVFQYQGRWWLAASDVADKGANSELHLWFAEAPRGPWEAHPGNPVKIDVRSARPAGAPFWVDGALYRPAQDCSSTYGARVIINRVLALTPTEFCEEVAATVNPDPAGKYPAGLHTLSTLGDRTLIDGKRSVFVGAEFFRVLRHYLR